MGTWIKLVSESNKLFGFDKMCSHRFPLLMSVFLPRRASTAAFTGSRSRRRAARH